MELLERYVQAVAHYLPAEQKQDIMRELRANLLDELESLEIDASNPKDTQALTTFLQRQDHPQRIAQSYAPQYPLVASEDMGLYKTIVLKGLLVLFVYAVVTAGSYLINAQSVNAIAFLLVVLSSVWDNIGGMLIIITATFYLLGKSGYLAQWRYPSWTPESLPPANAQRISTSDGISDVITSVFGLLLLWTPLWLNEEAYNSLILGIAPNMEQWRITLTIVMAGSLIGAIYRLTQTYWTRWSMGAYIAEYLIYISVMLTLWSLPSLFVVNNPVATKLTPIIEQIFTHGWLVGAVIFMVITASEVRKWRKL